MWSHEHIIKLEIGKKIVKLSNNADYLIKMIHKLRNELASVDIFLPSIQIVYNKELKDNEYICYWGIEWLKGTINNINEFYQIFANKAQLYGEWDWGKDNIKEILRDCIESIENENYQDAYEDYQTVYYIARIQGYNKECIQALTEVSGLLLALGEYSKSSCYADAAIKLCRELDIIDPALKCQAYLNNANIAKIQGLLPISGILFWQCALIAQKGNNSLFLFLSLLGMAECSALTAHYHHAINYYKQALHLLSHSPCSSIVANKIYATMIGLYDTLENMQDKSAKLESRRSLIGLFRNALISIVEILLTSMGHAAIVSLFGIQGGTALISFGTRYALNDAVFNAPTVIGDVKRLTLK